MTEAPTGVVEQLDPLVARVLAPNPSPFTYTGTQTYLVGEEELAVIDPGPDDPAHIEALVAAIAGRPVTAILCTHTHRDHSPASRPLGRLVQAPIIGCAPLALNDSGPRADAAFDDDYRPGMILGDGARLAGREWTLEAVATPGHTSNHLCYALLQNGALFTGDHVMGWSTSVVSPPDGDMAAYMASLDKLLAREDVVYHSAHGPAITEPHAYVRHLIEHRRKREAAILDAIGAGVETIPAMVERIYVGLDPRLNGAAGRSVLAHLIDLQDRGLVEAEGEQWRKAA